MSNSPLQIRLANQQDVEGIRGLLADDRLGRDREDMTAEGLEKYLKAFALIQADPGNDLYVAKRDGHLLGTFQITWIPYLSRAGTLRAVIEAVRVASASRDQGIGSEMMRFAIEAARAKGCTLIQLTSDKTRENAHRFYQRLGFQWTHFGMKMALDAKNP
jgi:ribosomal protein S18 acetylase RimI-like enzyme